MEIKLLIDYKCSKNAMSPIEHKMRTPPAPFIIYMYSYKNFQTCIIDWLTLVPPSDSNTRTEVEAGGYHLAPSLWLLPVYNIRLAHILNTKGPISFLTEI